MPAFVGAVRVPEAEGTGQAGQRRESSAAVAAGVLRLFIAFIERVPALAGTARVAAASAAGEAGYAGGLVATVFAIVVGHSGVGSIEGILFVLGGPG